MTDGRCIARSPVPRLRPAAGLPIERQSPPVMWEGDLRRSSRNPASGDDGKIDLRARNAVDVVRPCAECDVLHDLDDLAVRVAGGSHRADILVAHVAAQLCDLACEPYCGVGLGVVR